MPPASTEMNRLVITAKAPEIVIPCPVMPSVTCRSAAIGVSRLTGMNSDATSAKAQIDMANTPLQAAGRASPCLERSPGAAVDAWLFMASL